MKRPGPFLPAAAAAVLLAVLAAPGCGSPAQSAFLNRPGEAVNVIVEFDAAGNKVVVSNDTIYLRVGKDWAQWVSPDGEVDISPKGDSPFSEPPKHVKKVLRSGRPKKGTENKGFDYKVILTLPDGTSHELDPRIEVMP